MKNKCRVGIGRRILFCPCCGLKMRDHIAPFYFQCECGVDVRINSSGIPCVFGHFMELYPCRDGFLFCGPKKAGASLIKLASAVVSSQFKREDQLGVLL